MIVAIAMRFQHLLAIGILTASSLAADDLAKITAEAVRENYRTFFARITNKPKSIGAEFAESCAGFPGLERMAKETGPHFEHYVHYYLNGVAQLHRDARSGGAYPAGSVIVKEKLWGGYGFGGGEDVGQSRDLRRARDFTRVTAVAGMIKRESGSSPTTGDWEFFYFLEPLAGSTDQIRDRRKAKELKSCVGCHSNAADMVFGRFDKPYVMPKAADGEKAFKLKVAPPGRQLINPGK